jgi:hypothetical protein
MQSFAFDLLSDDKKTPSKYLEAIKTKLANIESNTNSSSISSNVEDIKELLTKR